MVCEHGYGPCDKVFPSSVKRTMRRMKLLLLLLLCTPLVGTNQAQDDEIDMDHLDELISLSELPLQKLLNVRHTFEDDAEDENLVADEGYQSGVNNTSAENNENPEALPLTASGGKSRRVNPLFQRSRFRSALRRGGKGGGGGWMDSMDKSKKGSISSIFQTSVTALAFLAFGGYLLCLIVQAVRAKDAAGDFPEEPQRVVLLMQRPIRGRRRRSANKSKIRDLLLQRQDKNLLKHTVDNDDKTNISETPSPSANNEEMVNKNEKLEGSQHQPSNSSIDKQPVDFTVQYWPMANVDAMYRALVMIAEGYSMYHQVLHT